MIKYQPVIPSSLLQERTDSDFNYSERVSNNMSLKVGVVIEVIELEDKKNISKTSTEYNVMTIEQQTNNVYGNCLSIDGFGGISDFFGKKLRATKDPTKLNTKSAFNNQNGSVVLLLCLDGHSEQAVIIGSMTHPDKKNGTLTKAKGHHMEGEFNGVNWQVDKDGALTVTFKSPSDADGKYKDSKAGGSTLKIEKDGSIEASDGNKEKIRLDKTNKTVAVTSEKDISVTTDASVNITAKAKVEIKSTSSMVADAGGSITMKSAGSFGIDASAALNVKAASVNISADGGATIKGSTIQLSAPSVMVGDGGTPAVTLSTQFLGTGNMGAPVLCVAVGPFSSSVFIGS